MCSLQKQKSTFYWEVCPHRAIRRAMCAHGTCHFGNISTFWLQEEHLMCRGLRIASVLPHSGCFFPSLCPLPSAPFSPLCPPQLSPLSNNVTALPVFSQFIVNSEGLAGFSSTLRCLLHRDVKQNMKRASRLKHTEVAGIPAWPHNACSLSLISTFSQIFPQEPHQLK